MSARLEFTEEELERIKNFTPTTVKKRKLVIGRLVAELRRRRLGALDQTNKQDLAKVVKIAIGLFPENSVRKCREYAVVAIQIHNRGLTE